MNLLSNNHNKTSYRFDKNFAFGRLSEIGLVAILLLTSACSEDAGTAASATTTTTDSTGVVAYTQYVQSHDTHSLVDQVKALKIECTVCHNDLTADPLIFADMQPLASTTVCDTCHSPGGSYPGVDGLMNAAIGAKANFKTGGIYESDGVTLKAGKEKWCATCHDEVPSVINDIAAPNTIGNESASYIYGTGYGYYKTGHGLSSGSTFPYSGGTINGAGIGCMDCHAASRGHIDGIARTYGADRTTGGGTFSPYRDGYRLKDVGGNPPMEIPFLVDTYPFDFLAESAFALCFSCHSFAKFQIDDLTTRFRKGAINSHAAHFGQYPKATVPVVPGEDPAGATYYNLYWKSAWSSSPAYDSRITCITCHNVHGSTQLGMIRDGKLIGEDLGIPIRYYDASVSFGAYGSLPVPDNMTLDQSTGSMVDARYMTQVCKTCHGGSWDSTTPSPWDR